MRKSFALFAWKNRHGVIGQPNTMRYKRCECLTAERRRFVCRLLGIRANNAMQSLISNVSGDREGDQAVEGWLHRADSCAASTCTPLTLGGVVYNYWQVNEAQVRPRKVGYTTGMSSL